jgi:hypothetical protein
LIGFDSSELSSIRVVREMFSHISSGNLAYMKSKFGDISSAFTHLEAVGAQFHDSLELVQGAKRQIGQARGKVADTMMSRLKNVLF